MKAWCWRKAAEEELGDLESFLRSREEEAAGFINRLLRDGRLSLPSASRGALYVATEAGSAGQAGVAMRLEGGRIHGAILKTSTGVAFPLLPPATARNPDSGIPPALGESIASIVGPLSDVERFEAAMRRKPIVAISYALMSRPLAAGPLPGCPGPPDLVSSPAGSGDLDELLPLQEAYEKEEVLTPIHSFDASGCGAGLQKSLREQIVIIGRLEGVAVAKAATNARAFSLDQLGGIYVERRLRRKGIGRVLVTDLVELLRSFDKGAVLFVKESNLAARGLYDELGFGELGPFRADYFIPD